MQKYMCTYSEGKYTDTQVYKYSDANIYMCLQLSCKHALYRAARCIAEGDSIEGNVQRRAHGPKVPILDGVELRAIAISEAKLFSPLPLPRHTCDLMLEL